MRRILWSAPYSYSARGPCFAYRAGWDMRKQVVIYRGIIAADLAREALRLYGPAHPQAASA